LAFILHSKIHSAVLVDSVHFTDSAVLHGHKFNIDAINRPKVQFVVLLDSVVNADWVVIRHSKSHAALIDMNSVFLHHSEVHSAVLVELVGNLVSMALNHSNVHVALIDTD
jgi:hypothetical protein